ncbi:MAG: hypothetical protein K2O45_05095 [Oscillospiraceae bacterium]|nr:hypothetical protein [Oscillospiraceae bacterium]
MNDRELRSLSDEELEALMQAGASSLPPDDNLAAEIPPWRKAINRALLGIALNLVTFNFWCLNYILPFIGTLLLLLGFRAIRRENRGFTLCWHLAVLQAVVRYGITILNATVWQAEIYQLLAMQALPYVMSVLSFIQILGLRSGFRTARQKVGLPPAAPGTTALAVWFLIICILALMSYTGFLGWLLIIAYFIILRTLWKLPRQMEEAGYAIEPAPVRLSDRTLGGMIFIAAAAGIACGYLFASGYDMDWQPLSPAGQTGLEELRTELLDLGFPEVVLDDLLTEDLAACEGVLRIITDQKDFPVNGGRIVIREENGYRVQTREYDVNELRLTSVAVELPGERERWHIIHHFEWIVDPGFYGTESMQFWPAYHLAEGWSKGSEASGRVLYDQDGVTYTAPYHYLGELSYQSNSIFWGTQQNTDLFAAFSFPAKGQRQRGYVAYDALENEDGYIIDSWINYTHQNTWFQYPVQTAMENRMQGSWNLSGKFKLVQTAIQFYPNDPETFSDYGYTVITE